MLKLRPLEDQAYEQTRTMKQTRFGETDGVAFIFSIGGLPIEEGGRLGGGKGGGSMLKAFHRGKFVCFFRKKSSRWNRPLPIFSATWNTERTENQELGWLGA